MALGIYARYWEKEAEKVLEITAQSLMVGRVPSNVEVDGLVDIVNIQTSLSRGYERVLLDNIGWGFRSYEGIYQGADGARISMDVVHSDGAWRIYCCGYRRTVGHN